jgi:NAD(P)-dependent dehydrogenase (short-subunit alcohol dehydrogenase family)
MGKRALVTGSSHGIGLGIAQLLCANGCTVVLNGRSQDRLDEALGTIPNALAVVGDVTVQAEAQRIIAEVLSKCGGLDILVCNVGSGKSVAPGEETAAEWQRVFAINLWSATNMVEAATEPLSRCAGTIVCVSSICGMEVIPGAPVTYSVAKSALNSYVKGSSRPLAKRNIRINAVAPGNVLFPGSTWEEKLQADSEAVQSMLDAQVSQGRLGTAEDIANAVVYLVSDKASFVTGTILTVDGGQLRS